MKNKKLVICIVVAIILFISLAAVLGLNKSEDKNTPTSVSASEKLSKADALKIYTEAYTIWCDWMNSGYLRYGVNNGERIKEEYIAEDGKSYEGYFEPIKHETINSVDKLKELLSNYFVEDVYSTLVDIYYKEKDGVLYGLVDFYGETWCSPVDEITATLLIDGIDRVKYEFTHPCYYPGDVKAYESVKYPINFVKDNGKWKISDGDWQYSNNLYEFPTFD